MRSSLLALLALLTLGIKTLLEWKQARAYELAERVAVPEQETRPQFDPGTVRIPRKLKSEAGNY